MIPNTIKYKAIVFDVGDTLLEHHPSQSQIYAERMKSAGFVVDAQISRNIATAIEKASHFRCFLRKKSGDGLCVARFGRERFA